MLQVWTWIMWWKYYDLVSVYSAFHSGQFLSVHRSHSQVSLKGENSNKLCFGICNNLHLIWFLFILLFVVIYLFPSCVLSTWNNHCFLKLFFLFHFHWWLMSGHVSHGFSCDSFCFQLFWNYSTSNSIWLASDTSWAAELVWWAWLKCRCLVFFKHLTYLKTTEYPNVDWLL